MRALTLRSAEHDTAMATGQEAPWRGRRITRTSWAKYLPPNCAPMPSRWAAARSLSSSSVSRKARPSPLPSVGRPSRYRAEASFTVFMAVSAEVPPTTTAT